MAAPWFEAEPEAFAATREDVEGRYPGLEFQIRDRVAFLVGQFPLANESGRVIDEFDIEMEFPHDLRRDLPLLRETEGRIPYDPASGNPDRHVNPGGTACLFVAEDFWFSHPTGYSVIEFLEGPVRHWLVGQVMYEADGQWPWEERSHGLAGIMECYQEMLCVDDPATVLGFLHILQRDRIKGHWRCPCGSGVRLRSCCIERVREWHERLPQELLRRRWRIIRRLLRARGVRD